MVAASLIGLSPALAGPMDLGGQFSVSESGAASYSIPIQVPPGIAGMEPKLAFSYNSQTGNGLLGMAWSLSGLSAITRCPRTFAQDGGKSGVGFNVNDRFCLDGQRLMKANAGDTYGNVGIEYRTERESFSKIVSNGGSAGDPTWFEVRTKAGQIIEYGRTADSRIEAQSMSQARVWTINKISDTKGNYLTFSYTEDNPNGAYVPSRIDYTGVTGGAPVNSVRLTYEARPDNVPGYIAGRQVKTPQRLKTLQTYAGANLVKEYRLGYATSPSSNRSRLVSLSECAMPDNACKPPLSLTWTEFGSNSFGPGSSWTTLATSWLVDVDGDGRADMVAQQGDGLYVALSTGAGVGSSSKWISSFGTSQGYSDQNLTPLFMIDVNGDGLVDAVGFASDGVYVALSTGSGFGTASKWLADDFGTANGWTNMDAMPRTFADVNGDGRPDIVGFKNDGAYVALNSGIAFGAATKWSSDFGSASTLPYLTNAANPRLVQDMDGDGLPDLVGFADGGVYVGRNGRTSFYQASAWLADFGVTAGYTTQDTSPRTLADVNGDGLPDIVGFKSDGVYVSVNTGTSLLAATLWLADFGTATTNAYSSQKAFPRYVLDINGDGKTDIIGFAASGAQVSLGTGTGFGASSQWVAGFGSAAGYTAGMPRQVADLDGDGFPDVVGTLSGGTTVALSSRAVPPDWITAFAPGLGLATSVSYDALTKPGVYVKDSDAVYPLMDLKVPLYVVTLVRSPNALGSGYTLGYYQYGGFKVDLSGRGALGFGWQQMLQTDSNLTHRTDFRQDWPYLGLPAQTTKTLGNGGLLGLTVNSYACTNPQTGAACTVAAGNRYFPYASQTTEAGWDTNGAPLPVVATTNKFEDGYGNATEVKVTTEDGFTKTTTNTYINDTTNWFLGRLTRSQVASESTGVATPNMSRGEFVFNQTISTDTQNYNLRNAATLGGWDQSAPLKATVTVAPGITVSSTSTTTPAFDTGSNFPAGATLTVVNNGSIIGRGGKGGQGYGNGLFCSFYGGCQAGTPGEDGGTALGAQVTVAITNNGTIAGGGGGGGGGGYAFNNYYFQNYAASGGGGGGGGAGQGAGGAAGIAANGYYSALNGNAGNAGTANVGGAGGNGNISYNNMGSDPGAYALGGTGGAGGGPGLPGATGANGSAQYVGAAQAGGAAGPAVTGNVNITWTATGTRLGPLVSGGAVPLAITAISPDAGPTAGGTPLMISGAGFIVGTTLTIDNMPALGCTVISPTRMTCLAPAGTVGSKNVVVSATGSTQTLANGYTYQSLGVTAISPTLGSSGTFVTLTGTGFAPGVTASFGGVAAISCSLVSSTTMNCIVPANSAGIKDIKVGLDETSATLAGGFTHLMALTTVTPNAGTVAGGTSIALTGDGFATGATVTIGGVAATGCVVASLTSMTCTTPANTVGAKSVVASLGGSSATLASGFSYQLSVTGVSPNAGALIGGTAITLTGNGFAAGATATIGGIAATGCTVVSPTSMTCTTPANTSGYKNVVVSLAGSTATLINGFNYRALGLTSVSPNSGSFAGGTVVTLTGNGFATGTTVTIGGVAATGCNVVSLTSMTCITPANSAGAKAVVVSLGSSTATLATGFTYRALALTGVSPSTGSVAGGTVVTMTGNGFATGATVTIGGVVATGCSVDSLTSMSCNTPVNSVGVKDVVVSLGGSTATRASGFTYQALNLAAIVISTQTVDFNLRNAAIAAGWNQTDPLVANVTVNSGVYLLSTSTAIAAFDTGSGYPAGSVLTLINNGRIIGKGGAGGAGGGTTATSAGNGLPGENGGPGLRASYPISISNGSGRIGGGGGGGGGGGSIVGATAVCAGGGAGGGQGVGSSGAGGIAVAYDNGGYSVTALAHGAVGAVGHRSGPGSGGSGGSNSCIGGRGGDGGDSGSAGQIGGTPTAFPSRSSGTPGVGGPGGPAVIGNSNITWTTIGIRTGALQ